MENSLQLANATEISETEKFSEIKPELANPNTESQSEDDLSDIIDKDDSYFSASDDENANKSIENEHLDLQQNNLKPGTKSDELTTDNKVKEGKNIISDVLRHDVLSEIKTYKQALTAATENVNHSENIVSDRSFISVVLRGQAKAQQLISSINNTQRKVTGFQLIKPTRNRIPPKLVRLATVYSTSSKSQRVPKGPSLYYVEPKCPPKVISWDEANNARPPLKLDMEGPSPWTYSPNNKPLNESNAPAYTFGTKCYTEKAGGSSTSWGKTWFQPIDPWHNKSDFQRETKWPTPNQYKKPSLLGPRQRTMPESPAYTFGHKYQIIGSKSGNQTLPAPSDYNREKADNLILRSSPSFSHQFRREGTVLWCSLERNPGPAAYTPLVRPRLEQPAYSIQGIRREKSQLLGPFSTL
ncbi:Protein stpg3 [Bulinus truncatus]|nr:Protein stpg3 [Bulinus truncatus]